MTKNKINYLVFHHTNLRCCRFKECFFFLNWLTSLFLTINFQFSFSRISTSTNFVYLRFKMSFHKGKSLLEAFIESFSKFPLRCILNRIYIDWNQCLFSFFSFFFFSKNRWSASFSFVFFKHFSSQHNSLY